MNFEYMPSLSSNFLAHSQYNSSFQLLDQFRALLPLQGLEDEHRISWRPVPQDLDNPTCQPGLQDPRGRFIPLDCQYVLPVDRLQGGPQ